MADFTIGGSWDFNQLSSNGLANAATAYTAYYDPTSKLFSYDLAPSGTFNPAAPQTITGDWAFNAGFDVSAPNSVGILTTGAGTNINITSSSGNVTLQSGLQTQIFSDSINFNAQANFAMDSINADMNLNASAGNFSIGSLNSNLAGVNSVSISTSNGGMNINTANGSLNINAGNGPTTGDLNLGSGLGNIFINAPGVGANGGFSAANSISFSAGTGDANFNTQSGNVNIFSQSGNINLNVNTNPGSIGMNAQGGNWGVSDGGVAGGTNGGAGANITADGDFSFGSGAPAPHGTFLFGSLTNTVTILAHLGMSLVNDTNDSTFQATAGFANIIGGSGIKLLIPILPVGNNVPLLIDSDGTIHI